jgi:S1-C subfamily serine protease
MVLIRNLFSFVLLVQFLIACERIPDWELRPRDPETLQEWAALESLRPWIWTCRGRQTQYRVGEQHSLSHVFIDRFRDSFRNSGLRVVEVSPDKIVMGSAFLWDESGHLVSLWQWADQVSDVECRNFKTDWISAEPLTKDQAFNLALYKVQLDRSMGLTKDKRWVASNEETRLNEPVFIVASSISESLERMPVYPQVFSKGLQTGVDRSLLLFQPHPPMIFRSGLLIDSRARVLGFLFQPATEAWGAALKINDMQEIMESLIHSGRFVRPFLGMRVQFEKELGFVVKEIEMSGPAHRAGLRVQDKILKWDDKPLERVEDWPLLDSSSVGKRVAVQYQRDATSREAKLEIGQF